MESGPVCLIGCCFEAESQRDKHMATMTDMTTCATGAISDILVVWLGFLLEVQPDLWPSRGARR